MRTRPGQTTAPDPVRPPAAPDPEPAMRPSRLRWLPAAGPGALMLTLGLVGSTRSVLSWDEVATADAAHRSAGQIWALAHHIDAVFSPYYLAMHGWTALFGDSVLSLRLPSILAMAGAAAVTGELGRRLFGTSVGAVAGVLMSLIPNTTRYAAEARPYAGVCLLSTLSLLLLYRAVERPGAARWLAYAAAVLGIGLGSLVALTALAGHAAVLIIRRRGRAARPWSVAVAGPIVLLIPLIWWGLRQRGAQLYWVPPMKISAVYTFPQDLAGTAEVAWALIGLLLLAIGRPTRRTAEMLAAAGLPLAVVCAVSFAASSFWVPRYLLFVLMPAMIAAGAALARPVVHRRPAGWVPLAAALAVVAAAAIPGQVAVRQPTFKNGTDYRTLAAVIRAQQRPGDDIVLEPGRTLRAGLDYYLRRDPGRPADVLVREPAAVTATLTAAEYADPAARLVLAPRIWLIVYGRHTDPTGERTDLRQFLRTSFRRVALWEVKSGTMALYVRRR